MSDRDFYYVPNYQQFDDGPLEETRIVTGQYLPASITPAATSLVRHMTRFTLSLTLATGSYGLFGGLFTNNTDNEVYPVWMPTFFQDSISDVQNVFPGGTNIANSAYKVIGPIHGIYNHNNVENDLNQESWRCLVVNQTGATHAIIIQMRMRFVQNSSGITSETSEAI